MPDARRHTRWRRPLPPQCAHGRPTFLAGTRHVRRRRKCRMISMPTRRRRCPRRLLVNITAMPFPHYRNRRREMARRLTPLLPKICLYILCRKDDFINDERLFRRLVVVDAVSQNGEAHFADDAIARVPDARAFVVLVGRWPTFADFHIVVRAFYDVVALFSPPR